MNIIGIDLGTSLSKIIECDEKLNIVNKMISYEKEIEKVMNDFTSQNNVDISKIEKIVITGVGSSKIKQEKIRDIEVIKTNEFLAVGLGSLELAKKEEALIASMGTGTAIVKANGKGIEHLGGTGVGGATLLNLAGKFAGTNNFDEIVELSKKGTLENVDLTIGDITEEEITTLPSNITAANFGKLNEKATKEDIILGIINMIFEVIGMFTVFASKSSEVKDVILVGSLTKVPYIHTVIGMFKYLCDLNYIIPENAEYAVAIGAVKNSLKLIDK